MGIRTFANLVSTCFFLMTLATCLITSAWMSGRVAVPDLLAPATRLAVPTLGLVEQFTPSYTPTPSETPQATQTWTPSPTWTASPTQTSTFTNTPTITNTPTRTSTMTPSSTSTQTPTPTLAPPTATPTQAPPTATVAPFPFELLIPAEGLRPQSSGDCNFAGFGGTVLDMSGQPVTGVQIVVTGATLPPSGSVTTSGSSTIKYGQGGWEVQVAQSIVVGSYTIQLRDIDGTALSAPVPYTFSGSCQENLLFMRFQQVRDY